MSNPNPSPHGSADSKESRVDDSRSHDGGDSKSGSRRPADPMTLHYTRSSSPNVYKYPLSAYELVDGSVYSIPVHVPPPEITGFAACPNIGTINQATPEVTPIQPLPSINRLTNRRGMSASNRHGGMSVIERATRCATSLQKNMQEQEKQGWIFRNMNTAPPAPERRSNGRGIFDDVGNGRIFDDAEAAIGGGGGGGSLKQREGANDRSRLDTVGDRTSIQNDEQCNSIDGTGCRDSSTDNNKKHGSSYSKHIEETRYGNENICKQLERTIALIARHRPDLSDSLRADLNKVQDQIKKNQNDPDAMRTKDIVLEALVIKMAEYIQKNDLISTNDKKTDDKTSDLIISNSMLDGVAGNQKDNSKELASKPVTLSAPVLKPVAPWLRGFPGNGMPDPLLIDVRASVAGMRDATSNKMGKDVALLGRTRAKKEIDSSKKEIDPAKKETEAGENVSGKKKYDPYKKKEEPAQKERFVSDSTPIILINGTTKQTDGLSSANSNRVSSTRVKPRFSATSLAPNLSGTKGQPNSTTTTAPPRSTLSHDGASGLSPSIEGFSLSEKIEAQRMVSDNKNWMSSSDTKSGTLSSADERYRIGSFDHYYGTDKKRLGTSLGEKCFKPEVDRHERIITEKNCDKKNCDKENRQRRASNKENRTRSASGNKEKLTASLSQRARTLLGKENKPSPMANKQRRSPIRSPKASSMHRHDPLRFSIAQRHDPLRYSSAHGGSERPSAPGNDTFQRPSAQQNDGSQRLLEQQPNTSQGGLLSSSTQSDRPSNLRLEQNESQRPRSTLDESGMYIHLKVQEEDEEIIAKFSDRLSAWHPSCYLGHAERFRHIGQADCYAYRGLAGLAGARQDVQQRSRSEDVKQRSGSADFSGRQYRPSRVDASGSIRRVRSPVSATVARSILRNTSPHTGGTSSNRKVTFTDPQEQGNFLRIVGEDPHNVERQLDFSGNTPVVSRITPPTRETPLADVRMHRAAAGVPRDNVPSLRLPACRNPEMQQFTINDNNDRHGKEMSPATSHDSSTRSQKTNENSANENRSPESAATIGYQSGTNLSLSTSVPVFISKQGDILRDKTKISYDLGASIYSEAPVVKTKVPYNTPVAREQPEKQRGQQGQNDQGQNPQIRRKYGYEIKDMGDFLKSVFKENDRDSRNKPTALENDTYPYPPGYYSIGYDSRNFKQFIGRCEEVGIVPSIGADHTNTWSYRPSSRRPPKWTEGADNSRRTNTMRTAMMHSADGTAGFAAHGTAGLFADVPATGGEDSLVATKLLHEQSTPIDDETAISDSNPPKSSGCFNDSLARSAMFHHYFAATGKAGMGKDDPLSKLHHSTQTQKILHDVKLMESQLEDQLRRRVENPLNHSAESIDCLMRAWNQSSLDDITPAVETQLGTVEQSTIQIRTANLDNSRSQNGSGVDKSCQNKSPTVFDKIAMVEKTPDKIMIGPLLFDSKSCQTSPAAAAGIQTEPQRIGVHTQTSPATGVLRNGQPQFVPVGPAQTQCQQTDAKLGTDECPSSAYLHENLREEIHNYLEQMQSPEMRETHFLILKDLCRQLDLVSEFSSGMSSQLKTDYETFRKSFINRENFLMGNYLRFMKEYARMRREKALEEVKAEELADATLMAKDTVQAALNGLKRIEEALRRGNADIRARIPNSADLHARFPDDVPGFRRVPVEITTYDYHSQARQDGNLRQQAGQQERQHEHQQENQNPNRVRVSQQGHHRARTEGYSQGRSGNQPQQGHHRERIHCQDYVCDSAYRYASYM